MFKKLLIASTLVFVGAATLPLSLVAQSSETVRGKIVDDSGKVVVGATVTVTRGPDRLVQTTLSDSVGQYSSHFEEGTGDYLVHVAYTGFQSARRRVQRVGSERVLVADFTLARDVTTLAAVITTANRPVRASNSVGPGNTETGGSEQWSSGVNGQVLPGSAGDLAAMAGTLPGVTITGAGPTMLGASSESNLTTLNGMALPGGSLPRAARTNMRVTGATFDPTRGGFSGANIDVHLGAGDRNFQRRNAFLTLNARQLQVTDQVGRSLGLVNRGFRGSVGADGEAIRTKLLYNIALDVDHRESSPATLVAGDANAWQRAGVSPDSITRLLSIASQSGIPVAGSAVPSNRARDAVTFLGRFDYISDSLRTLTLTTYLSTLREGALGYGPLAAPAAGGENKNNTMGVQFMHSQYVGKANNALTQNRLALSRVKQRTSPYQELPSASVLVRSITDASTSDIASLSLGGNSWLATNDASWTAEGSNETIWMARGSRHRFKSQAWFRADGLNQTGISNERGSFTYNSLQDFADNKPSSYSRTVQQPERSATALNSAVALAHQWNPSRWFNMLYGARVEGNAFSGAPPKNSAIENSLAVKTGVSPLRVHVSPRVGFNYTYNRDRDNGNSVNMNQVGTFYRPTMGFLRGGIGEFRDLYRPSMLADAVAGAGLPGSTLFLSCVGSAVPIPDWQGMNEASAQFPSMCADGSGALAERAPSVTLVSEDFDVPRSWRASLGWASNVGRFITRLDALGTYDLSQPSTVDANFAGISQFTLASEGNRPVYVSPAAIDANTGIVSAREARISDDFGRVAMRTSDLRGYGGQITTTIQPDMMHFRSGISLYSSVSYTLQRVLRQYRGFDGANFGDPRTAEWSSSNNDARHAFVLQGGVSLPKVGTITLFSRVQSGLPFTPIVQGDVDGDGRSGDRAFIPTAASDANSASAMSSLLAAAPNNVRECLVSQGGQVAGRNSCRGPWTQQLNLTWTPQIPFKVAGRSLSANVVFENPLAGIDQLVNGASNMKGWGAQAIPDPVLLIPRGYDAAQQRFNYDVNPRFGDTRAFRTLSRSPFRVTIDFSMDLSTPFSVQRLRRVLEPVKIQGRWERRSTDSIASYYLRTTTSSIYRIVLANSDSLFLTSAQHDALFRADSIFGDTVRKIYAPLAEYLANHEGNKPGAASLDSAEAAESRYWSVFWDQVAIVVPILTPQQIEWLPLLKNISVIPKESHKGSRWYFGYPVPLVHNRPRIN